MVFILVVSPADSKYPSLQALSVYFHVLHYLLNIECVQSTCKLVNLNNTRTTLKYLLVNNIPLYKKPPALASC